MEQPENMKENDEIVDTVTGVLGLFRGFTEDGRVQFKLQSLTKFDPTGYDWTLRKEDVEKISSEKNGD